MKALKISIILILSVIMGLLLRFLGEASVIDSISLSFFVAVESFLGFDLRGMIKETKRLPAGTYKAMHLYRYIIVMIIMAILEAIAIYVYTTHQINCLVSMGLYGGGVMVTGGMILGGLQENKTAEKEGPAL